VKWPANCGEFSLVFIANSKKKEKKRKTLDQPNLATSPNWEKKKPQYFSPIPIILHSQIKADHC
jgi:hypothetical protein